MASPLNGIGLKARWIGHLELGDIESRKVACRCRLGMEPYYCQSADDDTRKYCEHHGVLCLHGVSSTSVSR